MKNESDCHKAQFTVFSAVDIMLDKDVHYQKFSCHVVRGLEL